MARIIKPASFAPGNMPVILGKTYDTGETFVEGGILVAGDTNQVKQAGADPTEIIGVAAEPAGSRPGYELGHSSQVLSVTHRKQKVGVWIADRIITWSGEPSVAAAESHVGNQYGVVLSGTRWLIDISETTNVVLQVTKADVDNNFLLFKWLEAALATP